MSTPENPFGGAEPELGPEEIRLKDEFGRALPAHVSDAGLADVFPVWSFADVTRIMLVTLGSLIFTMVLAEMIAAALPAFRNATGAQIATDPRIVVPAQAAAYLLTIWFVYRMLVLHYRVPLLAGLHWNWPRFWFVFPLLGIVLSLCLQVLSSHLPIPKQLPIDELFRTTTGAWLMAIYGTLVAPLAEEVFFRGLLYPSLVRKWGLWWAVTITSITFALIHAGQLGWSFAAVGVLVIVGFVLTTVRALSQSLAASVLVHVSYNGFIFVLLLRSTQGFTKL